MIWCNSKTNSDSLDERRYHRFPQDGPAVLRPIPLFRTGKASPFRCDFLGGNGSMNVKAKRITTIAMLCALAYVVMAVGRVPVVLFFEVRPEGCGHHPRRPDLGADDRLPCLGSRLRSGDVHCQRHGHSGLYHEHSVHLRLCLYRLRHLPEKAHAGRGCRRVGRRMRGDGQRHAAVELSPPFSPSICSRADSIRASPSCSTSQWSPLCGKAD